MQVISRTHVGLVRENNEDALLVREPYLFAVADGMGGYAAGEIASRSTIKAFEAATHSLRHEQGEPNIRKVMLEAFDKANAHVFKMAVSNTNFSGMGTTMTALYLADDASAYCCHVGDSRLYLYREGQLRQLTRDHTLVADLEEQGKLTAEEAFVHPKRNILLQALGVEEKVQPDFFSFQLQAADRLLLCSDGLSDMLRGEEICQLIGQPDLAQAADAMLKQSLDNGGRDNVSLILLALDTNTKGEESCNGEE